MIQTLQMGGWCSSKFDRKKHAPPLVQVCDLASKWDLYCQVVMLAWLLCLAQGGWVTSILKINIFPHTL